MLKAKNVVVLILAFLFPVSLFSNYSEQSKQVRFNQRTDNPIYMTDTYFRWDTSIDGLFSQEDVENVVKTYVPERYVNTFLKYTECNDKEFQKILRLQLIAMGCVESDWTENATNRRNKNKSIDWGFLQLNSFNYKNDHFMWHFKKNNEQSASFYNYKPFNREERYLIVCINYYRHLYRYCKGSEAMLAYNGGIGNYERGTVPLDSYVYRKKVKNKFDSLVAEIEQKVEIRVKLENLINASLLCKKGDNVQRYNTKNVELNDEMYCFWRIKNESQFDYLVCDRPKRFYFYYKTVYFI